MFRIVYYRSKCIGCNYCVEHAPFRWRINRKDGKCTLVGAPVKKGMQTISLNSDEYSENQLAAEACPVGIIHIIDNH